MSKPSMPLWFKIAVGAAILWTLAGVFAYYSDVTISEETLAAMPEAQRAAYEMRPAWVVGAYAIAVFAALAGAILLALRKKLATPLFALSLAAVIVQMGFVLFGMNVIATLGASAAIFPAVIIILGAAMLWLSMTGQKRGWVG
ncbi:hypothetical protein [Hyphococcus sp.]|uniref:hypothetical protein n=1 Tax=Hyphococcus sp. TaxID=2038636 RepID=UPI003D0E9581